MSDVANRDIIIFPELKPVGKPTRSERRVSRVLLAFAHGEAQVLLCEEGVAFEFVKESGASVSTDGFMSHDVGVDVEDPGQPGVYVGELRVVDGGPESWEMPQVRDYYPQIGKLRPVTKEEWKSHVQGEWPEGWNEEVAS